MIPTQAIVHQNRLPSWIIYAWMLFFILTPFYLFGSGLPQPGDWIMAGIFLYAILNGLFKATPLTRILTERHRLFVIYVTLVNTLWFFFIDQSQEKRFPTFLHSFFYIFNFLTLLSVLALFRNYGLVFIKYTAYAIGASLLLQAALSVFMGSTESRNQLFFNNPNQLGYYALLSGSLFIYIGKYVRMPLIFQLLSLFAFFYLTLLSSSKAALGGSIILISLAVINQGLLNFRQLVVLTIGISISYYFITQQELGARLFEYSLNRFGQIGESKDDSYEGRGYDRILNNPEFLVLGAGEGGYYRFDTLLKAGEIHSSFGTLIFCYGFVGFILFFRFLGAVFARSKLFDYLYFLPVFVYSITHQGLRDTLFWVFLAVVFVVNAFKASNGAKSQVSKVRR